jgi:hypothetical protein
VSPGLRLRLLPFLDGGLRYGHLLIALVALGTRLLNNDLRASPPLYKSQLLFILNHFFKVWLITYTFYLWK